MAGILIVGVYLVGMVAMAVAIHSMNETPVEHESATEAEDLKKAA